MRCRFQSGSTELAGVELPCDGALGADIAGTDMGVEGAPKLPGGGDAGAGAKGGTNGGTSSSSERILVC